MMMMLLLLLLHCLANVLLHQSWVHRLLMWRQLIILW
jgi:hypothetical protein